MFSNVFSIFVLLLFFVSPEIASNFYIRTTSFMPNCKIILAEKGRVSKRDLFEVFFVSCVFGLG